LSAAVLRNVQLHQVPHELVRPGCAAAASGVTSKSLDPQPDLAALQEQAFAEGLRQAGAAAARQLAEARASLEARAEEARRLGFQQGRAEGLQRAQQEAIVELDTRRAQMQAEFETVMQDRMQRLQALQTALEAERQDVLLSAEDELVIFVNDIVCRILAHKAIDPEVLRHMAAGLVRQAALAGAVQAHVHPDDFAALGEFAEETWNWQADPTVQVGGMRLRTSELSVDARLETQLAELRQRLAAGRESRTAARLAS